MKLQWTFLRSKVERRLFGLFLSCAIVPILALSIFAFDRVTENLREQSRIRLHQASKATAMVLAQRLSEIETELDDLFEPDGELRRDGFARHHFLGIAVEPEEAALDEAVDAAAGSGEPWTSAQAHLHAGKMLLRVDRSGSGAPRILVEKQIAHTHGRRLITAEVDPDFLFDAFEKTTLPTLADFCVLDETNQVVACSVEDPSFLPSFDTHRSISGQFEWERKDGPRLGYFWSIFLKPNYHAEQWTIVLSEPLGEVLAPVASFRTIYPALVVLSVFLVSLLCVNQIRQRLVPLKQLRDGTRRVADRDFGGRIAIESGDEFQELADSFNLMATRLSEQFDSLGRMIDIDRGVLSALDRNRISHTVTSRIRELYPCDAVSVSVIDPGPPEGLRTEFSLAPESPSRVVETNGFTPHEARQLEARPDGFLVELGDEAPHYLALHVGAGMRQCLLLPLVVRQQIAGVVALGHALGATHDPKRLVYARQIADQTARALANVLTIEENRALAYYDRLTGLPNRLLFRERLDQAVMRAKQHRETLAVCLFGLDSFKRINDTLGHDAGDALLAQVAERAQRIIPASSLARIGGDEFAVLLTGFDNVDGPARIAKRILDAIETPFSLPQQEAFLTASIGIAIHPEDGLDSDVLMRNADVAMYHAKERSGNSFQFYARHMNATAFRSLELEGDLRRAIENGEMRLYYQPIVDIDTLEPVSAEALMRWQHPRLGLIRPAEFIPLAESTGLIVELGRWALMTACSQNTAWQDAGLYPISVSVNLSSRQLIGEALLLTVRQVLASTSMNPAHLVLELTESMLMTGDDKTLGILRGLKDLGIRLSIDDFGTGYSSLSYLKNFPLDHLKVDRSFLQDVTHSESDAALTRAIVAMAHSLGLRAVGEGVETEEQLAFLRGLRCETVQGYLISEPLPSDGMAKFLGAWETPTGA